jgi:hypothetical protein
MEGLILKHNSTRKIPFSPQRSIQMFYLGKNPGNAQYMLTLLYSHCHAATCVSPQGAILKQY